MKVSHILTVSGIIATLILILMFGLPAYFVFKESMSGRAELAKAEQNKRILIESAKAKVIAAEYEKKADSIRAVGVAVANKIISNSLSEQYIRWQWVQGLQDGTSEVIYIPTEANIPIMEASR